MKYIKPLDSIRTIAVLLVILSHWLPLTYIKIFDLGFVGVNIFFVLSGFLITRILLENKKEAEANNQNKLLVIKNFIIRRSLRIFPIYYLTILILFLLSEKTGTSIKQDFEYYVTYSSNYLFFAKQDWDGKLSHLWSLAVEEQFYLIWPWLIIFTNQKYLKHIILSVSIFGILSNYILAYIFPHHIMLNVLTPTCFDAFCSGAILAYIMVYKTEDVQTFIRWLSYLAPVCLLLFIFGSLYNFNTILPIRTLVSVFSLYLIAFTIQYQGSIVHTILLNNKALIFLGKVSYGIYLYHNFIPWIWQGLINKLNQLNVHIPLINSFIPDTISRALTLLERFALLVLISWLSWILIESPINKLKDRFNYKMNVRRKSHDGALAA